MRHVTKEFMRQQAEEIADAYVNASAPLHAGIVSKVKELELNPHQIATLTQLVNSMTHIRLFDRKEGDKIIEFVPADTDSILKDIYGEGGVSDAPEEIIELETDTTKTSQESYAERAWAARHAAEQEAESSYYGGGTKQASAVDKHVAARDTLNKVAEHFQFGINETYNDYREQLDKLASEYARMYGPDINTLQKEAFEYYGEDALGIVNDLRGCLHLDKLASAPAKKSSAILDDTQDSLQVVQTMVQLREKLAEYQKSLQLINQVRGGGQ